MKRFNSSGGRSCRQIFFKFGNSLHSMYRANALRELANFGLIFYFSLTNSFVRDTKKTSQFSIRLMRKM